MKSFIDLIMFCVYDSNFNTFQDSISEVISLFLTKSIDNLTNSGNSFNLILTQLFLQGWQINFMIFQLLWF